ncbi:MAG: cation:proton antiporter [Burkholderiales bacterium]|nr:cation:proton antiporter [Burkholderiales bacterium]
MHPLGFIQDLAVIMLIAGIVTILFHRFRQPLVLGYIITGLIVSPRVAPIRLIQDPYTIQILADLGIVFLMFSLGLEFSLKKLSRVGATATIAALAEITLMIWIGFAVGRNFGWSNMDALFLGAMLAISSTTIIVKALTELHMRHQKFAELIFGILIVEDILGIGIIALLSGIAVTGTIDAGNVFITIGKLSMFMIVALVLGVLIVPRLLTYVARFGSHEILLITVLGLCFGFCLLVVRMEYSIALGAFLIGAIMAEARQLHLIERLIEPIRDMFSAIFFVTIGLMLDPGALAAHAWPIAVITVAVIAGKVLSCSLGTFLAGHDGHTSMRVGMGLAQIGEFSFIIASLGVSLKVTSDFLFPVVVAVSAVTTFLTPYLIRLADPLSAQIIQRAPAPVARAFGGYTAWLRRHHPEGERAVIAKIVAHILLQIIVNCAVVAAVFVAGAYSVGTIEMHFLKWSPQPEVQQTMVWGGALLISLPFLIAAYRKLGALSLILAQLGEPQRTPEGGRFSLRRLMFELIPILSIGAMLFLIAIISASILPPPRYLIPLLLGALMLSAVFWKFFVRLHSRLQIALFETMEQEKDGET